jgi:carbamoyl-phosphate synthase large subunit
VPRRTDLRSILIVGSGPIRIGQACEFDYAGAQACRVLRREGYRVVLVNSNPATIMTDPEWADATYLEPLDAETVAEIVERERPDALLPTLGGQTALNLAVELHEAGVLERHGVELVGASVEAIRRAEDRERFREAVVAAGLHVPESRIVTSLDELEGAPLPAIVRPAFTLGGRGGGLAHDPEELRLQVAAGLAASPVGQVLVERSLAGWQEHELEVMADAAGNCVVVCSIENLDPMGVHTGDSWTVAPQQTLPDTEFQRPGGARPGDGRAGGHRDEPARLSLLGAGLEGHGLPDREARGAARGRLHAGRAAERHHGQDDRRLRARARLRGREGAALRLREVPRSGATARLRDASRGRGARAGEDVR